MGIRRGKGPCAKRGGAFSSAVVGCEAGPLGWKATWREPPQASVSSAVNCAGDVHPAEWRGTHRGCREQNSITNTERRPRDRGEEHALESREALVEPRAIVYKLK